MGPGFHEALGRGVALFNRQEFYEAHEVWEQVWVDEIGDVFDAALRNGRRGYARRT